MLYEVAVVMMFYEGSCYGEERRIKRILQKKNYRNGWKNQQQRYAKDDL